MTGQPTTTISTSPMPSWRTWTRGEEARHRHPQPSPLHHTHVAQPDHRGSRCRTTTTGPTLRGREPGGSPSPDESSSDPPDDVVRRAEQPPDGRLTRRARVARFGRLSMRTDWWFHARRGCCASTSSTTHTTARGRRSVRCRPPCLLPATTGSCPLNTKKVPRASLQTRRPILERPEVYPRQPSSAPTVRSQARQPATLRTRSRHQVRALIDPVCRIQMHRVTPAPHL